jgi:hypothetical protein
MKKYFKRQKERDAVLFLARIAYAAHTFIEVAKSLRAFRSIEIVSIPVCAEKSGDKNNTQQQNRRTGAVQEHDHSPTDITAAPKGTDTVATVCFPLGPTTGRPGLG